MNIRMRCHNRVKDARKGPGTSLIVEKYLRHTMTVMKPASAWAHMYGHVKAALIDSTWCTTEGNGSDVMLATHWNVDDPPLIVS